jgi:hypothetical protein
MLPLLYSATNRFWIRISLSGNVSRHGALCIAGRPALAVVTRHGLCPVEVVISAPNLEPGGVGPAE